MNSSSLLLIILGMFVVTYPVRFIPLVLFNRITLPKTFKIWLSYMPTAIFAALLTQSFYNPSTHQFTLTDQWPASVSCGLTLLITIFTRSIGWGLGLGFVFYWVLTYGTL